MMQSTQKAIGMLGGTFDPVHIGHLRMAIELAESMDLAKVHLIPCYQPVHRNPPHALPDQRLAMLEAAIANESLLYADAREMRRKEPSYTIATLEDMRQQMPSTPLCLLVGIDAFIGFPTWHRFNDILQFAHIIVATRPFFQLPTSGALASWMQPYLQSEKTYIQEHLAGGIFLQPMTALDISASDIRKQIALGRNPRYLLPDNVYSYIQQHGIYKR